VVTVPAWLALGKCTHTLQKYYLPRSIIPYKWSLLAHTTEMPVVNSSSQKYILYLPVLSIEFTSASTKKKLDETIENNSTQKPQKPCKHVHQ
jgi:outer membrane PBP1 activator LpoA protein